MARLPARFALLLSFTLLGPAFAQTQSSGPEAWLPAGTLIHLRVDDPKGLLASFAGHPFAALAAEPEVVAFVEALAKGIPESQRAAAAIRAFEFSTILSVLSGPASVSVLGFPEPGNTPEMLLTVGVSEPKAFESGISLGVSTLVSNTPGATPGSLDCRGVPIRTIDHPDWHVAYALVGTTFVLSNRDAVAAAAATAIRAASSSLPPMSGHLLDEPSFRSVSQAIGSTEAASPGVAAYVNVGAFLPRALAGATSDRRRLVKALGLGGVTAVGWRIAVEKGGIVDRLAIAAPGGFGGLLGSFPSEGRGLDAAARAPKGSLVSMAWQVDPLAAWDAATAAIREESPVAHEVLTDDIAAFEKGFGQGFRESLLGAITGEMRVTASLRAESAARPDVDLVIGSRNADALRRAAKRFSETVRGIAYRAIDFEGETIYVPAGDGAALAAIAPSFCATSDALIVSINPDSLKRAVSSSRTSGSTLGAEAEWRDLAAKAAPRSGAPFGAQYFDGRQAFSLAYNAVVPLVQSLSGVLDLPVDLALIPSAECITRHISASICTISKGEGTVTVASFGPLPGPAGPIALVAAGVALFRSAARGDVRSEPWAPRATFTQPSAMASGSASGGPLVTITRSDAPLAEVLEEIAKGSGLQYVAPEPLLRNRRVSLRLEAVPAREAFSIVCFSARLKVTERPLADGRLIFEISEP